MALFECVPNVSEGRLAGAIADIAYAVSGAGSARLLDVSSDASHHRSVFTLAGDREGLLASVDALLGAATTLIDLRTHAGVHPRMGAVDVVPFIPLAGTSMADCVALARAAGEIIGTRYHVPVYLYAEAATSPARRRLEDVRRGGFEGFADKMRLPGWAPDFGPSSPHQTAGVTAVGARRALIAYNIILATSDARVARVIAARVRESSGGLPCVKALGLRLASAGIVQVSMNLTDYEITPVERAFDEVARQAEEAGVEIVESELIGLIPRAALAHTTPAHLKLRDFSRDRILEERLCAAGLSGPG